MEDSVLVPHGDYVFVDQDSDNAQTVTPTLTFARQTCPWKDRLGIFSLMRTATFAIAISMEIRCPGGLVEQTSMAC